MDIIKHNNYHILRETVDFAVVKCNNLQLKSTNKQTYSSYYNISSNIHQKCIDAIHLSESDRKYFNYYSSYSCCLAQLLLFSFTPLHCIDSLDCSKLLIDSFHQYNLESFPIFYPCSNGLSLDNSKQSFVKTVQSLKLNDSEQLSLIYAFYNYDASIHELLNILKKISSQMLSIIHTLNSEDMFSLNDITENEINNFYKQKENQLLDNLISDETTLHIYPSLCFFESYTFYIDNNSDHYLFFGIGRTVNYLKKQYTDQKDEKIIKFLSAISDPTKLEILKNIKHTPKYGQELAQALNLKNPTISYHMDALFQLQLIKINKVQKRLYYSLNKNALEDLIDLVKDTLL